MQIPIYHSQIKFNYFNCFKSVLRLVASYRPNRPTYCTVGLFQFDIRHKHLHFVILFFQQHKTTRKPKIITKIKQKNYNRKIYHDTAYRRTATEGAYTSYMYCMCTITHKYNNIKCTYKEGLYSVGR